MTIVPQGRGSHAQRRTLFAVYAVAALAYLAWRIGFTLSPWHPVYAALFLAAEAYCIVASLVFYKLVLARPRREPTALAAEPPMVDVLICTYNEDPDLVRTTAVAARDMDLPHRTWICDDGRREAVAALAAEIGVGYITRPTNEHHKAGNLNHALSQTSGALVLCLDADHVPRREMLARMIGYLEDPQVAMVQTPQVFYNFDSFQHAVSARRRLLWHEASIFHHMMQPGADRLNAAFFVGTGALLRRSALEAIGGIATGSITEDIHTSMRLHARGFRTVYVDEALGVLLAPDTPLGYTRQRLRWAQGAMQILRRESPLTKRGLSVWQRVGYLNSLAGYLAAFQHLLFYLAPGIYLLWGLSPIAVDATFAFPLFCAHIALDLVVYKVLAAPHARLFLSECYKLINLGIFLRASSTLLRPEGLPFQVTPKGRHGGLPLGMLAPAAALFLFNLTAVAIGLLRLARGGDELGAAMLTTFFASLFSIAGALALLHAFERNLAHEPFAVPVPTRVPLALCGEGGEAIGRVRRLSHEVVYADLDRPLPHGARVWLDASALGSGRALGATVTAVTAHVGGAERSGAEGFVVRAALDPLAAASRDALDHFFFQHALPVFLARFSDAPPGPPPEPLEAASQNLRSDSDDFLELRAGLV